MAQITDWTPPAQLMNIGHPCQPVNGPRITQLLIATTPYSFNGTGAQYIKFDGVASADAGVTVSKAFQVSVDGSNFDVLDFVPGSPCFSFTIWARLDILSNHLLNIPYSTGVKSAVITTDAPPAISSTASTSSSITPSESSSASATSTMTLPSRSASQTSSNESSAQSSSSASGSAPSSSQSGDSQHTTVSAAVIAPAVVVPIVVLVGFTSFLLFYLRRRHRRRKTDQEITTPYSPATSSGAPTSLGPPVSVQDRKAVILGKGDPATSPSTSASPSAQAPSSAGDLEGEEENVRELASAMRNAGLTPAGLFNLLRRPSRTARGHTDADHDAEPLPGYRA